MNSLWPVYSKGLPLEPTAEYTWLIHTISFSGVGVFRTAEDQGTGRKEAAPSPKGNGQHGSVANGAGSAVDGPPRTVRVEEIGSEHSGGGMESGSVNTKGRITWG